MRWIRSIKVSFIAVSAVLIALGLWLLICPGVSSAAICVALGAVSVLYGTIKLLGYFPTICTVWHFSLIWRWAF